MSNSRPYIFKKLSVKNSVKKIKEGMNKNKNLGLKYLTYNLNL